MVRGKVRETALGGKDMDTHSHPLFKNSAEGSATSLALFACICL